MLLLTTLGVYIGLLMAGAAPGVVAQQAAAMTRNFELSEEVEVKDDLDRNPADQTTELDADVDLAALEVIVASYLERVVNVSFFPETSFRQTVVARPKTSRSIRIERDDFSASDVKHSPNFAYQQFPRADLDPLPANIA